jgi:hypothetical protein
VEKILNLLKVEGKDVRKGDWNNKEVNVFTILCFRFFPSPFVMKKSTLLETQLVEEGVTPHYSYEIILVH